MTDKGKLILRIHYTTYKNFRIPNFRQQLQILPLLFQIGQSLVLFWTVKYKSVCIYTIENWHKFLISLIAPAALFLQDPPPARILEVGHWLTSFFLSKILN
jgi:hypothetical protein